MRNASLWFYEIMIYIANNINRKKNEENCNEILMHAIDIIEENLDNPFFGVKQLALKLNISTRTLNRYFNREAGTNPKLFIDTKRFNHAISLLQETSLKLEDIAHECGYASSSYFCRLFKGKMHQTPTEFRNKII